VSSANIVSLMVGVGGVVRRGIAEHI
jgi:hypothetical protein